MSTYESLTYSGKIFDFENPTPEMVDMLTITHVLSGISRWNNHMQKSPVSLLGHSLMVGVVCHLGMGRDGERQALKSVLDAGMDGEIPRSSLIRAAFMHDASETWTGDMPGPLKKLVREAYKPVERKIERAVADAYGLPYPWPPLIKMADLLVQDVECWVSFGDGHARRSVLTPGFSPPLWLEQVYRRLSAVSGTDTEIELFVRLFDCLCPETGRPAEFESRLAAAGLPPRLSSGEMAWLQKALDERTPCRDAAPKLSFA